MKNTGMSRPIDDLGRVVIPKEIRNTLNLNPKDLMEIYMEGDALILKKAGDKCVFCGTTQEILPYNDKFVCRMCAEGMRNTLFK